MRSVVVVLPASMCAAMPIFRVHSSGNGRSLALTGAIFALSVTTVIFGAATADMGDTWARSWKFLLSLPYQRRCAKARLACAILWVSSFFLTTDPVLL